MRYRRIDIHEFEFDIDFGLRRPGSAAGRRQPSGLAVDDEIAEAGAVGPDRAGRTNPGGQIGVQRGVG